MSSDQVEGEFADDGEVLRGVVLAGTGGVLGEVDVEHSVKLVLDGPVGPGDLQHAFGGGDGGQEEPADGDRLGLAGDLAAGLDPGDGGDPWKVDAGGGHDDDTTAFAAVVRDRGSLPGALAWVRGVDQRAGSARARASRVGWLPFSAGA